MNDTCFTRRKPSEDNAVPRRRQLLQALSALPIPGRLLLAGGAGAGMAGPMVAASGMAATPACGAEHEPTPRQTEGPYFTRNSPRRGSLIEPGVSGTRLVVSGTVLSLDCKPLSGVLLDFWQADADGVYDNRGYRLRGHQFTGASGRYRLETVVPGLYPGRTRHIHVKVQSPDGPVLTTQLYFAGEPANRRDGIFSPELLMSVAEPGAAPGETVQAAFDFAVRTA